MIKYPLINLFSLFHPVIVDFDYENDYRRHRRDKISDYKRPVVNHESLDYEKDTSESKQKECWHSYTVGVAGADGVDGLREIAADHADGGCIADYVYDQW